MDQPPPPYQPPPPVATPARSGLGISRGWLVLGVLVLVPIGLAAALARPEPAPDPVPFAELAAELREFCPDTRAPRRSLIIGVPDGDPVCATAAATALDGLGFSAADTTSAGAGETVRNGRMKLSIFRATDGVLIGVDAD